MGRIHTSCVAAIVLSVAAFSVHAAENVVSNGNFEAAHWTSGYLENAGSKLIGWTIVGPCGISVPSGTYISTSIRSYDNSAWAFLKGVSSLSQDVTIDSDGDCILEFDFAGRPGNMNNAITKVSFGDTVLKIVYGDGGSQNGSKVAHHKIHFHATAGTHTLKFAQTASGDLSPALDNITLARVENSLAVTGNPATPGKPSPDYGTHYNLGTVTVSAPAVCTNSSGTAIYQCAGWKLFRLNAAGDWVFDATLANAEGQGNSFEYTPAANMVCKLVWLWSPSYLVSVSAGAGGSATVDGVSSNFYARGATCVLSAMPASPGAPAVWTGDTLPLGMSPTNLEFTTTVWAPMALTAKFNDVLWVDDDAASGGNGSYAAPYQTVDAALSAVAAGKCIAVMPGQYQLSGTKTISSAITVTGVTADFGDATVSSSNGARQAFKLTSSGAALRGLTVKGVGTQKAYGVVYLTAGLMENCRITGGLCNREASTYGSGVRNEGGTVRRCTMDGNTASGNIFTGLGLYQSSGLAEYCVITNNSGSIWHGSEEYPCPAGQRSTASSRTTSTRPGTAATATSVRPACI